jgi:hypothetical protein
MCDAAKLYLRKISVNENMVRRWDECPSDDITSRNILKVWLATRKPPSYRSVLMESAMDTLCHWVNKGR